MYLRVVPLLVLLVASGCRSTRTPPPTFAANALPIGDVLVYSSATPRTRERLQKAGFAVETVDVLGARQG